MQAWEKLPYSVHTLCKLSQGTVRCCNEENDKTSLAFYLVSFVAGRSGAGVKEQVQALLSESASCRRGACPGAGRHMVCCSFQ